MQSAYAYDPPGQMTAFTQCTGYAEEYAYDKAGNMTQKALRSKAGGKLTDTYAYDASGMV